MAKTWNEDQVLIGERIRLARKAAHLTQEQLAEKIGGTCTNKVISRYESGSVEMGVNTLITIAEALEVSVDSLMPERVQTVQKEENQTRGIEEIFARLDEHNRAMLLEMASMMELKQNMKLAI